MFMVWLFKLPLVVNISVAVQLELIVTISSIVSLTKCLVLHGTVAKAAAKQAVALH
jgi:hypothetical protein